MNWRHTSFTSDISAIPEFAGTITRKIDDQDPVQWISVAELREKWKD